MSKNSSLPLSEVLKRLSKIHPFLEFPKISEEYSNTTSSVTVFCKTHKEYKATIDNLIYSKSGCKKCRDDATKKRYLKRIIDYPIIKEVLKIHSIKDTFIYVNSITPIEINCNVHGVFKKSIKSLNRYKDYKTFCNKCNKKKSFMKPWGYYYEKILHKYGNKYEYEVPNEYLGSSTRLKIKCKKHGSWDSLIYNHLHNDTECPKSSGVVSKGSTEVYDYLVSLGFEVQREVPLGNLKVDLLIESKKIVIEYLGNYFHSTKFLKDKNFHRDRRLFINSNGYRTIFIWESEWILNNEKIKTYLKSQLGLFNKVYARKCEIVELSKEEGSKFITKNHLMGSGLICGLYVGLKFNDNIVACVGFRKVFKNFELYRAAYLGDNRIIGGLSKIVSYLQKNYKFENLVSYIDLDKFDGSSYYKTGFKPIKESISMSYFKKVSPISRHKLKKSILLKNNPELDSSLTEKELCEKMNIYQCWNSGTMRVELTTLI